MPIRRRISETGTRRRRRIIRTGGDGWRRRRGVTGERPLKEFLLCLRRSTIAYPQPVACVRTSVVYFRWHSYIHFSSPLAFSAISLFLSFFIPLPPARLIMPPTTSAAPPLLPAITTRLYKCQITVCPPESLYFW